MIDVAESFRLTLHVQMLSLVWIATYELMLWTHMKPSLLAGSFYYLTLTRPDDVFYRFSMGLKNSPIG